MSSQEFSSKSSAKALKKSVARKPISDSKVEDNPSKSTGRWTKEEHFRFLEALKIYGKEWKKVQ
jgi:hypothetical protein